VDSHEMIPIPGTSLWYAMTGNKHYNNGGHMSGMYYNGGHMSGMYYNGGHMSGMYYNAVTVEKLSQVTSHYIHSSVS